MTNDTDVALLTFWPSALRLIAEKPGFQDSSLGTAPSVSTHCLPYVTAREQISQAFPLHICVLQVIKYWRWEHPGNEAIGEQRLQCRHLQC